MKHKRAELSSDSRRAPHLHVLATTNGEKFIVRRKGNRRHGAFEAEPVEDSPTAVRNQRGIIVGVNDDQQSLIVGQSICLYVASGLKRERPESVCCDVVGIDFVVGSTEEVVCYRGKDQRTACVKRPQGKVRAIVELHGSLIYEGRGRRSGCCESKVVELGDEHCWFSRELSFFIF